MTVGRYAWQLLRESMHWEVVTLEIIEGFIILAVHPLERVFPEWKEKLDALQMIFAASLFSTFFIGLLIAGYLLHSKEEREKDSL
jgi:hypothetical protein